MPSNQSGRRAAASLWLHSSITRVSCRDICPLLKDPAALTAAIDLFEEYVKKNHKEVDLIVGKLSKQTAFFLLGDLKGAKWSQEWTRCLVLCRAGCARLPVRASSGPAAWCRLGPGQKEGQTARTHGVCGVRPGVREGTDKIHNGDIHLQQHEGP